MFAEYYDLYISASERSERGSSVIYILFILNIILQYTAVRSASVLRALIRESVSSLLSCGQVKVGPDLICEMNHAGF